MVFWWFANDAGHAHEYFDVKIQLSFDCKSVNQVINMPVPSEPQTILFLVINFVQFTQLKGFLCTFRAIIQFIVQIGWQEG